VGVVKVVKGRGRVGVRGGVRAAGRIKGMMGEGVVKSSMGGGESRINGRVVVMAVDSGKGVHRREGREVGRCMRVVADRPL
jgi:hypothetical protein